MGTEFAEEFHHAMKLNPVLNNFFNGKELYNCFNQLKDA
jgi:hypothetical protein